MRPEDALARLGPGDPKKADDMRAYHKVDRQYLGIANPVLEERAKAWRRELALENRITLASALWETNIHEARVLAGKLLTQARLKPDDAVWALISSWVPTFDAWAVADHASMAGQRRLTAHPIRLDEVERWTRSDHLWTRRAALVMTLPWTKQNYPSPDELAERDRILGWASSYVDDHEWFIQKAVAWWLRELSKHDAPRVRAFLDAYAHRMKPFARKEAARKLET